MAEAVSEKHPNEKRFEDFFAEGKYVVLKNFLYNYRCRQRAIGNAIAHENVELLLEVGSGLSPIVTGDDRIVYSELSFSALKTLKRINQQGRYVVADGTRLPFKDGAFSHTICSEVLEHVEDDQAAIGELARVINPKGTVYITVPHRKFYFAADDRFVRHFRRYEIPEMAEKIENAGMVLRSTTKVLGPLEKVTVYLTIVVFRVIQAVAGGVGEEASKAGVFTRVIAPVFDWCNRIYAVLARLDAAVMPKRLATVILFQAGKDQS